MKTILINTTTSELVNGIIYPDGYTAKHPQGKLKPNEAEAQVIETPKPVYDTATHKVIQLDWEIDTFSLTYTRQWEVVPLSDYEIAARDWAYIDMNFRITAPIDLTEKFPGLYASFQVRGLPVIKINETQVQIYVKTILQEHSDILMDVQESVDIEPRPEILTPDEEII